jgi:hypothetical protein
MSAAIEQVDATPNPLVLVRALRRLKLAGFVLTVEDGRLMVEPLSQLTDTQRTYLRAHKAALVALLTDVDVLATTLEQAGTAGLGWQEGTPAGWTDAYLLAVGELLYGDGRMVNRLGRRYSAACAPTGVALDADVGPLDKEAWEERAAIMEFDGGLPREEAERRATALLLQPLYDPPALASASVALSPTVPAVVRPTASTEDERVRCSDCRHGRPANPTDSQSWHLCALNRPDGGEWGHARRRCDQWETRP